MRGEEPEGSNSRVLRGSRKDVWHNYGMGDHDGLKVRKRKKKSLSYNTTVKSQTAQEKLG